MSKPTTGQKIGGEYGNVRAAIDVQKLNAYIEVWVPEVAAPVTVNQFKVGTSGPVLLATVFLQFCWSQFGQVRLGAPTSTCRFLIFGRSVESDLPPDRLKVCHSSCPPEIIFSLSMH